MSLLVRVVGFGALGAAIVVALAACAPIQVQCPAGTDPKRRMFSGGGEAEWCRRDDGVRDGLEVRYYESGAKMLEGAYLDGARSGEWFYYPNVGRPWRRDRWEDGALVDKKIDLPPRAANQPPVDPTEPTTSLVVSLGSADPLLGRQVRAREDELPRFASWYDDGKPRVVGHYDREGLRAGTWRFWFAGGGLAREIVYDAGVRDGLFREWWEGGQAKTDGGYAVGERDGRWRRWDSSGRLVSDQAFDGAGGVGGEGRGMVPP